MNGLHAMRQIVMSAKAVSGQSCTPCLCLARISHKGIRSSPSWHDNWWPESNLANLRRTSRPEHCVSDGLPAGGLASCSLPVVSAVQPVVLCTLCEKCGLGYCNPAHWIFCRIGQNPFRTCAINFESMISCGHEPGTASGKRLTINTSVAFRADQQ